MLFTAIYYVSFTIKTATPKVPGQADPTASLGGLQTAPSLPRRSLSLSRSLIDWGSARAEERRLPIGKP